MMAVSKDVGTPGAVIHVSVTLAMVLSLMLMIRNLVFVGRLWLYLTKFCLLQYYIIKILISRLFVMHIIHFNASKITYYQPVPYIFLELDMASGYWQLTSTIILF